MSGIRTEQEARLMLQEALRHHLEGRLNEADAIYQALLGDQPANPDVLHLSGDIACQNRQFDRAAGLVQQAIEANPGKPAYHATLGRIRKAQGQWEEAVESFLNSLELKPDQLEVYLQLGEVLRAQGKLAEARESYGIALSIDPDAAGSHFELGTVLLEEGRPLDAEQHLRAAVSLKPDYVEAHCNLGVAMKEQGRLADALASYRAALEIDPDHVDARYSLGVIYMMMKQYELAEAWYKKALELDPDLISAHVNLSWVLREAGKAEEARQHRDLAYRKQNLLIDASPCAVRTVLMLLDAGRGNVPYRYLLPSGENNLIEWMVEYATENQHLELPPYDVIFNAIGDPDVIAAAGEPLKRFMQTCGRPVLNPPSLIPRTARHLMPELFAGIGGIVVPPVWRVEPNANGPEYPALQFPVLVRPVASQGGEGLLFIESYEALARALSEAGGEVYLCNYRDYRCPDGHYRKYRVIFVDRKPYPYHLAISRQWMVHYHTADMLPHAWKLEEERRFLEDPASVLGLAGMAAIEAIGRRLDLDYAGVDFSILPDGSLLIFEANATMLAHPESEAALRFKNPYIRKILDAFEALLARASGKGRAVRVPADQ